MCKLSKAENQYLFCSWYMLDKPVISLFPLKSKHDGCMVYVLQIIFAVESDI